MQKERMGFPRKEITIVTKIYIYIYRQATKKGERKKKEEEMKCVFIKSEPCRI